MKLPRHLAVAPRIVFHRDVVCPLVDFDLSRVPCIFIDTSRTSFLEPTPRRTGSIWLFQALVGGDI